MHILPTRRRDRGVVLEGAVGGLLGVCGGTVGRWKEGYGMERREVCLADSAAVFGFLSFLLPSGMNTSVLHYHRKHLDLWDLTLFDK